MNNFLTNAFDMFKYCSAIKMMHIYFYLDINYIDIYEKGSLISVNIVVAMCNPILLQDQAVPFKKD